MPAEQRPQEEAPAPRPGGRDETGGAGARRRRTPEDRPDIRAAKLETRLRRWALALLIAVPAVWFLVQQLR